MVRQRCPLQYSILTTNLSGTFSDACLPPIKWLYKWHCQFFGLVAGIADHCKLKGSIESIGKRDATSVDSNEILRVANAWPTAVVHVSSGEATT
mmetsp:Transcript_20419/g.58595  ORF Transcript_20419/g.58595 Transcript_20419/m.58595 type:complete len:94 (-) Transcript_20419:58-339(-)